MSLDAAREQAASCYLHQRREFQIGLITFILHQQHKNVKLFAKVSCLDTSPTTDAHFSGSRIQSRCLSPSTTRWHGTTYLTLPSSSAVPATIPSCSALPTRAQSREALTTIFRAKHFFHVRLRNFSTYTPRKHKLTYSSMLLAPV